MAFAALMPTAVSPEQREGWRIFQLAGAAPDDVPRIEFATETNWSRLLQIAWDEGAVTALRNHVRALPPGAIPLDVQRRLACLALECDLRMRSLEQYAAEAVAVLGACGIEVVLLKGAALASRLYGSFTLRPMNDVDLLVDAGRAEEARSLLLGAGWMTNAALPGDIHYKTHHHLPPLVDARGRGLRLEIHRDLLPPGHPFGMGLRDVWRSLVPVQVAGNPAFVLPVSQHVLHLAIHFAWSHAMRSGAWHAFRDIVTLERAGLTDWAELVHIALSTASSTCCYWTLRLAATMADLPVPNEVLRTLAPRLGLPMLRRLERHFIELLVRRDLTPVSLRLERALWTMAIQPERLGHAGRRPWTVSLDLAAARRSLVVNADENAVRNQIAKLGRSGAHLGTLIRA